MFIFTSLKYFVEYKNYFFLLTRRKHLTAQTITKCLVNKVEFEKLSDISFFSLDDLMKIKTLKKLIIYLHFGLF